MTKIMTKVIHSKSKNAWNIIGTTLGDKYKIARIPYTVTGNEMIDTQYKHDALEHALFIRDAFNNAE